MPGGFRNLNYHQTKGTLYDGKESDEKVHIEAGLAPFGDDETAARHYMAQVMGLSKLESIKQLGAAAEPGAVPDLRLQEVRESPLTKTRTVFFQQTRSAIPVFGSQVMVELDPERKLVGLDAELADLGQISPDPDLSPEQALAAIAEFTGVPEAKLAGVQAPELNYFHDDEGGAWHLAYFFQRVPAVKKEYLEEMTGPGYRGHGLDNSLRLATAEMNYLVDAHDGRILFYYSANPMLDVPSKCKGLDEEGNAQEFFGRVQADGSFEMHDPLRNTSTYDLQLQNLYHTPRPGRPVNNAASDWAGANNAAVSAHVNAMRVLDFYKDVLKRDGVDGRAAELVSIVNVIDADNAPQSQWKNAVWWNNCMWYGQVVDPFGRLRSYSRYLDVIAHELTHGVTQNTSSLVYQGQSGALNESFSDIFGIIVKNWYLHGPDSDPGLWSWELGEGWGDNGLPLRDLSDPNHTGDPAHMRDYLNTTWDFGGVHTNSNIHNKAAYNVLTACDEDGKQIIPPREVATLYYLTLTRLPALADFSKVRQVLIDVARTFYAGDADERTRKIDAIQKAYSAVGIN